MVLVVIDAHSKVDRSSNCPKHTSNETIKCLRDMIARFGIPEIIVSDNGTSFTSEEFKTFVEKNGIRHKTTAPYHPATNGLAERAVQVIKNGLRKNSGDFELRLHATYIVSISNATPIHHWSCSGRTVVKQKAQNAFRLITPGPIV